MFNHKLCIGCGDCFIEFAYVKIGTSITKMTNIRFNWSTGFGSPKPNPGNMFRPKSSRYESRKMSIKHRNSVDSSDPSSDHLLHKRSSSLQSLHSVDNQSNIDERAKLAAKPRKIAWASRTCSEDKSVEPLETWNPCEIFDRVEPCIEPKNKLEESKKKSIDIFLSSNFIHPVDILPSYRNPKLSLLKSFTSSFTTAVDKNEPESNEDYLVADQETACIDESITSDVKNEKKVTFAADLSKPMNAETRRLNFRNSYSKRYTTNFSFSSTRLERQTSVNKCPIPKAEVGSTVKRGNSLSLAENVDESTATVSCMPSSPSPLFKQPVQPIDIQQTDKMKQLTIKRKLKSCRSRSFHKSLDSSSVIKNFDTFSFAKPAKSIENSDAVVTMVSLIVSNEEDTDPAAHPQQQLNKSDSAVNAKENIDNKVEKQTKTGILKSKWQSDNVKRVNTQSIQKRRFVNISHKQINSPEKTRTILTVMNNLTKTENEPGLDIANSSNCTYSEQNNIEVESKEPEIDKPLQSVKEQECWSSFRKMTNKGFSVSFDTILRGLLTPTEYRLRKSELLTQES